MKMCQFVYPLPYRPPTLYRHLSPRGVWNVKPSRKGRKKTLTNRWVDKCDVKGLSIQEPRELPEKTFNVKLPPPLCCPIISEGLCSSCTLLWAIKYTTTTTTTTRTTTPWLPSIYIYDPPRSLSSLWLMSTVFDISFLLLAILSEDRMG